MALLLKLIRLGASCQAAEQLAAAAGIKFREAWGQVGRDPLSAQPPTDHFLAQPRRSAAKALAAQGDG